ncbi:reverse transcriptase domain-containing protein [Pontibacter sp. G13]|uniref:reverse transcriptase domain-containing protein n=1 Tax=Pontibacter sp. G13 TaxID=3074898 RepID=UPI00288C0161|nr:reverse transcriptase domain-containing protein [Pontibacter sp. G13]WNJ17152.1 reverse transcriptase domain-containing protein [Pontibacter sp. G13]
MEIRKLYMENFFGKEALKQFFFNGIAQKTGKGIDKISPNKFSKDLDKNLLEICKKIESDSYKFSPYLEYLRLKGRDRKPRTISIPTTRDKIVLTALKEYLHDIFNDCVNRKLPNQYIKLLKETISNENYSNYAKLDIKNFYESIDHKILLEQIAIRVKDPIIMNLIRRSIMTPTMARIVSREERKKRINRKGVPQGLPVSNIMANIYLASFDSLKLPNNTKILRYVDDIFIQSDQNNLKTIIENSISHSLTELGLKLNCEKTKYGDINIDGVEYLGYYLKGKLITVKNSNIDNFIQSLASKFTWFKNGSQNSALIPDWLSNDINLFKKRFIEELNEKITGAKSEKKRYGWLFYFLEIEDLELLFKLDRIVSKFFQQLEHFEHQKPKAVKSFVRAFYEIRHNGGGNYILDYDKYSSIESMKSYLFEYGQINNNKDYTDKEIKQLFYKLRSRRLFNLKEDAKRES